VYGFDRPLDTDEKSRMEADLNDFVEGWTSHKEPVTGAAVIVEDRFVLLAGQCEAGIGGCSIDGSVALIRSFDGKYGLDAFDRNLVFFRGHDDTIQSVTRAEFQRGVDEGQLGNCTIVFDLTLTTLGELRKDRFETTFKSSWHANAFAPSKA
jgi:hypothetical protein